MIRIAHLADLHLGARLSDVPASLADAAADAPYAAFARAVEAVAASGFDAVLVAGDVFDRGELPARALAVFSDALDRWHEAGLRTVVISGNHDAESSLPARVRLPASVRWPAADAAETVVWDDLGVAVHAQSIAQRDDLRDLAAGYPAPISGLRNLGMLHTSLTGEHSRRACAPTTLPTLQAHGYDYWALGHVHERRTMDATGRIAFAGSVYGRRASEAGAHGFLDVRLSEGAVELATVDTAVLRYEDVTAVDAHDPVALARRFAEFAEEHVVWTLDAGIAGDARAFAHELASRSAMHAVRSTDAR